MYMLHSVPSNYIGHFSKRRFKRQTCTCQKSKIQVNKEIILDFVIYTSFLFTRRNLQERKLSTLAMEKIRIFLGTPRTIFHCYYPGAFMLFLLQNLCVLFILAVLFNLTRKPDLKKNNASLYNV